MERVHKLTQHLCSGEQVPVFGKIGEKRDDDVVIVAAKRTAITKARKGAFKDLTPDVLLTTVLKSVVEESKIDPKLVDDIIVGNVQQSGSYASIVRPAATLAGFPETTSVRSVNRQCSSGLQATADAALAIKAKTCDIAIGAGLEMMTLGGSPGDPSNIPPMALNDILSNRTAANALTPMGVTSENVAAKFGITREEQDKLAMESHAKALRAQKEGFFKNEIAPVTVTVEDADGNEKQVVVDRDEGPREGTTMEKLAKLKPAFKKDGSTTAGNSSQVSDGAAAVLLTTRKKAKELNLPIKGTFRGFRVVGVPSDIMGIGPLPAVKAVCEATNVSINDIDVFEINEAFASQATYVVKELGIPKEKLNPNGGAIALGHPLGCTGARMIATLLNELHRTNKKTGVVSMCIGTGMGAASIIEAE